MQPSASSPSKRSLSRSDLSPKYSPTKKSRRNQVSFYLGGDGSDEDEPKQFPTPSGIKDMAELEAVANAITFMNIPPTTLDDMPSNVLGLIGSKIMDVPVEQIEEVRACGCLGYVSKPFPFRGGQTDLFYDNSSQTDIRRDLSKCRLDRGLFDRWCLKQYLARGPGKKRVIPNFAAASKTLYKKWRDATAYVFCCENCVEKAILELPFDNKRLMTRIRFYERNNDDNIEGLSQEGYSMGAGEWGEMLTYETQGNQLVEYRGTKVWVKELVLPNDDI